MLTKFNYTPLKFLGGYFEEHGKSCNKQSYAAAAASSSSSSPEKISDLMVIGLQIIVQISSERKSNLIVKSAVRKSHLFLPSTAMESCFLKSCFLCNKNLSLDKDIYMYRGDKGFCSIECRNRQIYLDEMKEVEASTKKLSRYSNRYCSSSGSHETRLLLEDLRRRNNPTRHQNHWAIVS